MPAPDDHAVWPREANPRWPAQCLIEGVAIHPTQPWLAVACTDSAEQSGAVLVFDGHAGTLRSTTAIADYVGWSDDRKLLRWHPDGTRLATNVGTNGIALIDRARLVGRAFPDETRDSGVHYVWIDDRLFSDTGALFEIREGEDCFEFESRLPASLESFEDIEWNASRNAVVGRVGQAIAAFDPLAREVLYHEHLTGNGSLHWSDDGRSCARHQHARPPESDELAIISGDDGRLLATLTPSSPIIDELRWGPAGSLLVSAHVYDPRSGQPSTITLDVVRTGNIAKTLTLSPRAIQASHSIPEASGLAWSPTGDGIAVLLDRQEIAIFDASSGQRVASFKAPAPPIPPGLPDFYKAGHRPVFGFPGDLMWLSRDRLVRLAPHFVAMWSIDGEKIAEWVVPDRG